MSYSSRLEEAQGHMIYACNIMKAAFIAYMSKYQSEKEIEYFIDNIDKVIEEILDGMKNKQEMKTFIDQTFQSDTKNYKEYISFLGVETPDMPDGSKTGSSFI